MKKLDKTVKNESIYIALWVVILSLLMESVFLIISRWDFTVILGNLLGAAAAILNFFLLGLTVQNVANKDDQDRAKTTMKFSQVFRLLALAIVIILAIIFKNVFNLWATIIPLIFPRIAIAFRPLFNKKMDGDFMLKNKDDNKVENENSNDESEVDNK